MIEVLNILILNNFNVNVRDKSNYLPIETAILMKNVEAIKILAPLTKLEVCERLKPYLGSRGE